MKRISIIFILLLSLWLNYGCGSKQENPAAAKKSDAKLVKVQPVQTRKLVEKLQLTGNLRAENVANILSTVEGKISKLLVREGDRVQLNTVVAMVSSLVREDIINSARLLMQAKQEAVNKNPDNPQLQKELKQAQQDYQFALQQYKEIPVTSPIAGVVSQRWVDLGDMVPAKAWLFEIQSSAKLLVDVPVSEMDLRKLNIGQSAEIRADACPAKVFKGVIQRVYPQVEAKTRNGMVEIRLADPCPNLKAGMFVRITFVIRTLENAIAIPVPAVIDRPLTKACFIIEQEKAKEVALTTGLETDGWVEIVQRLTPGDKLVVEGQEQLKNGSPVKIQGAEKKVEQSAGGKR